MIEVGTFFNNNIIDTKNISDFELNYPIMYIFFNQKNI